MGKDAMYLITTYERICTMNAYIFALGFACGIAIMYWGG